MTILLLAEQAHNQLLPATLAAVSAARAIGGETDILVAGQGIGEAAKQAAAIPGIRKVLAADDAAYAQPLAENIAPLLLKLVQEGGYSHLIAAATSTGKDILPRAAALLGVAQVSDIIEVKSPDTFRRPVYAGNAIETVQSLDAVKVITVRQSAFGSAEKTGGSAEVETVKALPASPLARFVGVQENKSERPELTSARIVISGGRGLGSAENFKKLEGIAAKLNAAIGASRAAVDAGYVPNDYQVGQTGKIVAPDLYIAVGISGAIQHLAGMKDSKVIVAINKDENAPIFEIADYGLVGDLFQVLPELEAKL
jgi:electron transfer flavoprotein alpha subunit